MLPTISTGKFVVVLIFLLASLSLAVFFKPSEPPDKLRIRQFIATCTTTLETSSEYCQGLLEKWGDFFKR